ncbi:MAG: Fic family protein [Caulobacteraceae bacterium]
MWRWAGAYRTTDKNIGVAHHAIHQRLYATYDDFAFWIENNTFPPDELAARFHHALVFVHPFANGNGRWSRMMADALLARLRRPRFTTAAVRCALTTRRAATMSQRFAQRIGGTSRP